MEEKKFGYDKVNDNFTEKERRTGIPEKKKLRKYTFSILFMVILIAITLQVIFKDASTNEIMSVLKRADLIWVLRGIIAMLLCRFFQGLAIGMSARCIGKKLTLWETLQYALVGVFYSSITPSATGGQPMQFFYMCRDKMSISETTLVLFTTNMTYQIAVVIAGISMLIYKWGYIYETAYEIIFLFFIGFLMHFGMLLLLVAVMFSENAMNKLINSIVNFLARIHIIKDAEKAHRSVNKYISEVKQGVELIRNNPWRFTTILLITLFQVLSYHLVPYFIYKSFSIDAGFSCIDIISISSVLFMAMSFMPLPGTVGAAERGFVVLFGAVYPGHIIPATLLSRFINFYLILALSGIVSIYTQLRKPHNIDTRTNYESQNKQTVPQ